jgi:hypothetical protein
VKAAERDRKAAPPCDEEPAAEPPPAPRKAAPRPPADPADRVAWRTAARLREGVMEEQVGLREELAPPVVYDEAKL